MKKILVLSLVLVAGQGFGAQMAMTQNQFLDMQAKINKDILENPFTKETDILGALDAIEALKGTEPWKIRAKLWASGARKLLAKAKEAAVAKGMAQMPAPSGRLQRAEMAPQLTAPGLARRGETEQPKVEGTLSLQYQEALNEWVHDSNNKAILEKIGKLFDAGLNPDALLRNNQTPLTDMMWRTPYLNPYLPVNRIPLVELLLAKGANINGRNISLTTPLIAATWGHDVQLVAYLLNHGADVTLVDQEHHNALHVTASIFSNPDILKLLINHVQKIHREDLIDAQDADGNTPLMEAVIGLATKDRPPHFIPSNKEYALKTLAMVKLLIDAHANPVLKNKAGDDALAIAMRFHGYTKEDAEIEAQIIKLIKDYTDSWKHGQKMKLPNVGPLPAGPAHIVREYLLGVPEPEQKKEKAAPAKKAAETEEEEGE